MDTKIHYTAREAAETSGTHYGIQSNCSHIK